MRLDHFAFQAAPSSARSLFGFYSSQRMDGCGLSVFGVCTSAQINSAVLACGIRAQVNNSRPLGGVIGEVLKNDTEEFGSERGLRVTAYNSDGPGGFSASSMLS